MISFIGTSRALSHDMTMAMINRHNITDYEFIDVADARPVENLSVLVGEEPLAKLCNVHGIDDWRGSIIPTIYGTKCIPIKYPSDAYYNGVQYAILDHDFRRIVAEAEHDRMPELPWDFTIGDDVTVEDIELMAQSPYLAIDIESVKATSEIICVGFANGPWKAISIFNRHPHERDWIQRLLNCAAKKIFHFGSFDSTMLILDGYNIENYTDDTIIQAHVLEPEFPRDLGTLTSLYTKIPYFKSEGRHNIPGDTKQWSAKRDKAGLLLYNCKDCCATYQIFFEQKQDLDKMDHLRAIYDYEMEMIPVARDIGMNGMLLDAERNALLRDALEANRDKYQEALNVICGAPININSPDQVKIALYEGLGLPEKYKQPSKKQKQEGKTQVLTSNNDALISLLSSIKTQLQTLKTEKARQPWALRYHFVTLAIRMRGVNKLLSSYINITTNNGRVRSMYKVPGTETGRWSCTMFIDGTGLNAQTLPREAIEV